MVFMFIMPIEEALQYPLYRGFTIKAVILTILSTPVQFYVGKSFYISAYKSVRSGGANMDVLIALGTSAAYFYSVLAIIMSTINPSIKEELFFETAVLLIMFVMLGRMLENIAKGKTSEALTKLLSLQATSAILVVPNQKQDLTEQATISLENSTEQDIDTKLIQKGDILKVLPGTKVPTDGIILQGSTSTDESMVTGESMPVNKTVGDTVIGATLNIQGMFYMKATKIGSETALSQIIKLIEDAQTSKAPIQKFADKISGIFVPIVIALSIITFVVWFVLAVTNAIPNEWYRDEGAFLFAFLKSIAVLVIAW